MWTLWVLFWSVPSVIAAGWSVLKSLFFPLIDWLSPQLWFICDIPKHILVKPYQGWTYKAPLCRALPPGQCCCSATLAPLGMVAHHVWGLQTELSPSPGPSISSSYASSDRCFAEAAALCLWRTTLIVPWKCPKMRAVPQEGRVRSIAVRAEVPPVVLTDVHGFQSWAPHPVAHLWVLAMGDFEGETKSLRSDEESSNLCF